MSEIKLCPNCGKYNLNDAKFCENCGQQFEEEIQKTAIDTEHAVKEEQISTSPQDGISNAGMGNNVPGAGRPAGISPTVWIVIGVAAVILLAVAFLLGKNTGRKSRTRVETTAAVTVEEEAGTDAGKKAAVEAERAPEEPKEIRPAATVEFTEAVTETEAESDILWMYSEEMDLAHAIEGDTEKWVISHLYYYDSNDLGDVYVECTDEKPSVYVTVDPATWKVLDIWMGETYQFFMYNVSTGLPLNGDMYTSEEESWQAMMDAGYVKTGVNENGDSIYEKGDKQVIVNGFGEGVRSMHFVRGNR